MSVVGLAEAVTPALGQTAAPGANAAQSRLPDFSGIWWRQSPAGMKPPTSGSGPVTNLVRREDNVQSDELVGEHGNPILKSGCG